MNTDPGKEEGGELLPNVAAVGAIYGDPDGKFVGFLAHADEAYPAEPYFLWNQPLSDNGWVSRNPTYGGSVSPGSGTVGNDGNGWNSSRGSTEQNNGSIHVVASAISVTLSVFAAWLVA